MSVSIRSGFSICVQVFQVGLGGGGVGGWCGFVSFGHISSLISR